MQILDATLPSLPDAYRSIGQFDAAVGRSAVAVFDFDGVLCDPIEDRVYRLAETPGERDRMKRLAPHYGLDPDLYDTPYLRHLLLQAVLAEHRHLPAAGPLLPLCKELSATARPFFVLTARSGMAAIKRMLGFVEAHSIMPQEIFCVGRVAKGRQLKLIRETVSNDGPIVYFDDSRRHVRNSSAQDFEGLETVHVVWSTYEEAAARDFWQDALNLGSTSYGRDAA